MSRLASSNVLSASSADIAYVWLSAQTHSAAATDAPPAKAAKRMNTRRSASDNSATLQATVSRIVC
jgi:hypothetical protein